MRCCIIPIAAQVTYPMDGVCGSDNAPPRAEQTSKSRRHPRRLLCNHVTRRMSADVDDAHLGLCLSRRLRLCWKLKHRRLLALNQACQENTRAIGKFECVVVHLWHVLVDLPKDRRPSSLLKNLNSSAFVLRFSSSYRRSVRFGSECSRLVARFPYSEPTRS